MSPPGSWVLLDGILVVVGAWLAIGVAGVAALRRFRFVARVLFPAGGAFGLVLGGLALAAVAGTPEVAVLPLGLPGLPFHLRLDSLGAFGTHKAPYGRPRREAKAWQNPVHDFTSLAPVRFASLPPICSR